MVTTNHAEVMALARQPLVVFQCSNNHCHAPCVYGPGNWLCTGGLVEQKLSFDSVHPALFSQPPAQQKFTHSPDPVPQLHEALDRQRQHKVAWDITEIHSMARCITSRGVSEPVPISVLSQPATCPAVREMRIVCESFLWEVLIHIPQSEKDKVITVGLVLEAIHGVMQEDLEVEDWESKSNTLKKKIHTEMCTRLSMAEPSIEAKVRVLKIDSLLGRTEFMGMECVDPGEDTKWLLSLGPPGKG